MARRTSRWAAAILGTALLVVTASPAAADPVTPGASAYAAPAGTGTATLSASLSLTGALGGLLDPIVGPIVQNALNPLVTALQGTVNTLVASTVGVSSSFTAGTPSEQVGPMPGAFPGDLPSGLPDPCVASGSRPCFSAVDLSVNAAPLASVTLGALSGYTQQVDAAADPANPIFGRAQVAGTSVSVLPAVPSLVNPLVAAAAVDAKASCPNDGTSAPAASVSATDVRLLGGLVRLDVLNGQIANLTVNGTSYSIESLPTLSVAGLTIAPYGSALRITVALGLDDLLSGLGLSGAAVSDLLGYAIDGTSLRLSVVVGPNRTVDATSAKGWGLGVGVDLSGTLRFDLLGLVGAAVTLPTGIGGGNFGNVVDLRLGYASCTVGSAATGVPPPAIPPALI